jgi:hypothetical protein
MRLPLIDFFSDRVRQKKGPDGSGDISEVAREGVRGHLAEAVLGFQNDSHSK